MSHPPGNRGPAIVKVAIVSPIVASLFVFLRLYCRTFLTRALGWDDFTASLTLLSSVAYSVLISEATYNGMGRHIYDMPDDLMERYSKWIVISSELYLTTLLGYKLTILMTYHRIFSVSRRFKYVCWTTMAITTAYLVCNMITEVTGCYPLKKFWDKDISGHCVNFVALDITYGAMNVLTDFAIALLPLRMVWRLKMDRKERIGLSLIFLTAIVAFVVALVRWIFGCVDLTSHDRTWIAGLTFLWSVLEVNTGLICACCLPLKPLLHRARTSPFLTKVFSSSSWSWRSSKRSSSSDGTSEKEVSKPTTTADISVAEKGGRTGWLGRGRKSEASDQEPMTMTDTIDREMRRLGGASGERSRSERSGSGWGSGAGSVLDHEPVADGWVGVAV